MSISDNPRPEREDFNVMIRVFVKRLEGIESRLGGRMIFEVNTPRNYEPGPPERDPEYLKFIRAIGC